MDVQNSQLIGWTAITGGIVAVIGFICLILLFTVGEPFGTINDFLAIPTSLLLIPLVLALHRLHAADHLSVSRFALFAGLAGFLAVAVGSALLVLDRITFEQSLPPVIVGFGFIGLWVLLNSVLGLSDGTFPRPMAWVGIFLGLIPTLILPFAFRADRVAGLLGGFAGQPGAGSQVSPLLYLAIGLGSISYALMPFWYIWVGRLFTSGRLLASLVEALRAV